MAEIRLDPAWTPTLGWSLDLDNRDVAQSFEVLDSGGKAVGQVRCPDPTGDGRRTIGPLQIEEPSAAFATLWDDDSAPRASDSPMWSAAAGHEGDAWVWGCWQDGPPKRLRTAARLRGVKTAAEGRYRAVPVLRACRYYQSGLPVPATDPCVNDLRAKAADWYGAAYGATADCDLARSKLCPDPVPVSR